MSYEARTTKTWFMDENMRVSRMRWEDDVTFADLERVEPGAEHYRVVYGDKVRLQSGQIEYRTKGEHYYHRRGEAAEFIQWWVARVRKTGRKTHER